MKWVRSTFVFVEKVHGLGTQGTPDKSGRNIK